MASRPHQLSRQTRGTRLRDQLHNGDCISQKEFHELYDRQREAFKAELLDGVVYVAEPVGRPHGKHQLRLGSIIDAYAGSTPGVEGCDNATVILGRKDEVQPDLFLRILPEYRGQSGNTYSTPPYVQGAPELVAEISYSSRSIDLHLKKERYAKAGVIEYLVLCLQPLQLRWFDLRRGVVLSPNEAGVICSAIFPGLWINGPALLSLDYQGAMNALNSGLASSEHEQFVARLALARR